MIETIILSLMGLGFLVTGFKLWKKEKIEMLNAYHHEKISEKDKKEYTKKMGKGLMLLGCGMIANPLLNYLLDVNIGWFVMVMFFLLAMILMFRTQKKYNGSIF